MFNKTKKEAKKKGSQVAVQPDTPESPTPPKTPQKLETAKSEEISPPQVNPGKTPDDKPLGKKENINFIEWISTRTLLSFRVVEAKDLIKVYDGFKEETFPFVRVTLPSEDANEDSDFYETTIWKFKTYPLWNQEFKFETFGNGPVEFTIEVLDKDDVLQRENPMGSCTVAFTKEYDGWIPLKGVESGQIRVVIKKIE
jgi:hypothetical protein